MNILFSSTAPEQADVDVLAIYVSSPPELPDRFTAMDATVGESISRELGRERLRSGKGDTFTVVGSTSGPGRILVLGLGSLKDSFGDAYRSLGAKLATHTRGLRCTTGGFDVSGLTDDETRLVVEGAVLGNYRNNRYKSDGNPDSAGTSAGMESLTVFGASDSQQAAALQALAVAEATNWARDLANCPGNLLPPAQLAKEAEGLASLYEHLSVRVLDFPAIQAEDMGMIRAVGQGSANDPRVIVLEWNPPGVDAADTERLALVGKAITFDTGGISLKPGAGMQDMRMDKGGGCAVLGAMRAIAELGAKQRVLAVIASAENMPGSRAYKPGDVITAMDGTTVEIGNTDAEGRLVLGDAITYARKLGCAKIVEASTLTGAMVVSLGHYYTGLVARTGEFKDAVQAAADRSGDHAWHMPMHNAYKSTMKSDIADINNAGARSGGALYAALFLEHFAKDTPFVHLDIAGTGMLDKAQRHWRCKGATGVGVRLFTELALST